MFRLKYKVTKRPLVFILIHVKSPHGDVQTSIILAELLFTLKMIKKGRYKRRSLFFSPLHVYISEAAFHENFHMKLLKAPFLRNLHIGLLDKKPNHTGTKKQNRQKKKVL